MDLERFKKSKLGLKELAAIIESANPSSCLAILKQIKEEDPAMLTQTLEMVVFFKELTFLDAGVLEEILATSHPRAIAQAWALEKELFEQRITPLLHDTHKEKVMEHLEKLTDSPSRAIVVGAQRDILRKARDLEKKHKIIFELTDCPRFQKKNQEPSIKKAQGE